MNRVTLFIILFSTFWGSLLADANTFFGAGNVGIGTTFPAARLCFNTVHRTNRIDGSTWHNPNQISFSLGALGVFIANICPPSAKRLEANGIQFEEMNMILVKKIEESTLVIHLQNAVEQ